MSEDSLMNFAVTGHEEEEEKEAFSGDYRVKPPQIAFGPLNLSPEDLKKLEGAVAKIKKVARPVPNTVKLITALHHTKGGIRRKKLQPSSSSTAGGRQRHRRH